MLAWTCTKHEPPPTSLRRVDKSNLPRRLAVYPAERLLEVAQAVVSTLAVEAVLRRVVDVARELTGARYAALGVLDDQRSGLSRFLTIGIDDETRAQIGNLPRGHGVLGELIRNPVALRL